MSTNDDWKAIVASSLDWEQAHATLDHAVANLTPEQRATKPEGLTHSVWDIVEHIRIAQNDLLDFVANADYHHDMTWPDDYWPAPAETVSDEDWEKSLAAITRDREKLKVFTTSGQDLTATIPWGTGQTYLRTILVSLDHTSYHTGEIVAVRRLIRAWPPGG